MERWIERMMYASRWLLAPVYFGLSLAILAVAIKFFQELAHLLPNVLEISEGHLILSTLGLIDMALVASLLVMVMLSSYENFVSRLDIGADTEKLDWLGKLDAGTVKQKVAASIVAISSIHLLRMFMRIEELSADKLLWYVLVHLTLVVSALMMGWLDRISKH